MGGINLKKTILMLALTLSFTVLTTSLSVALPPPKCPPGSHLELVDGTPVCVPDGDGQPPPTESPDEEGLDEMIPADYNQKSFLGKCWVITKAFIKSCFDN